MLTIFIGREPELAALSQLLADPQCRLLTLIGPSGIGKTRLAIQVATQHRDIFPDGIWFVPLAPLRSSTFLIPTIADALNFRFQDPAKPQEQLLNNLREKRALLVLDNAEHLLDGVSLFAEILKSSLQVKLMVTSHERLNLLSEWVFEIQGLPVPPGDQTERFEEYSSVALFLQSARRTRAGFELRDDERRWVVSICQILEGMPLGIELAAAWVGLLSCEEIAKEIERNLDFLTASVRDLPECHRSLRAALDHSWSLLNSEEKLILSRLSVFRGRFRREAAEQICGASLGVLSSLKDKSLLRRTDRGCYDLHQLIHQYAAFQLAEDACEDERVKDRHAIYYAQLLADWEKALKSSRQVERLTEMELEIDILRQAWQRMVTCCDLGCEKNTLFNLSLFQSSLFSLSMFYEQRCRNWEAISLFEETVECLWAGKDACEGQAEGKWHFGTLVGQITAYLGLHYIYVLQYERARELLEEALRLLENSQARVEAAQAKLMLGWVFQQQFKIQKASFLYQEGLSVFREEGDVWWEIVALHLLAGTYLTIGNVKESVPVCHEGLRLSRTSCAGCWSNKTSQKVSSRVH